MMDGPFKREEVDAALERLIPYLNGYPAPMMDSRRIRIAAGTATSQDHHEIAVEDYVWDSLQEDARVQIDETFTRYRQA